MCENNDGPDKSWKGSCGTIMGKTENFRMKKIVIITNIPSPYRVDFFDYLQRHTNAYEIHILYASRNEENRSWEIEKDKMRNSRFLDSYTIRIPRRFDTKYIHVSRGVAGVLEELQPAVVVASEYNPTALQALRYCLKKKVPYISWTDGTLNSESGLNWFQKRLRRYVIGHATAFLASSTKSREAQLTYGADLEKCFISFLTVDLEKYTIQRAAVNEKTKQILCVGSLIERKGLDLLLEAAQGIEEDYILALAGSGPEENNLKKLVQSLGMENRVKFLGYLPQKELKKEYGKSTIFAFPTRQDCFALVILEAMCAGLPVICSRYADGAYDLVDEGKNGYIVDPYNKEQFRRCMQELLRNPKRAEQMGGESIRRLGRFRFEEVCRGFWDAIDCVLNI